MGIIEFHNVIRIFKRGKRQVAALDGADFFVKEGEFCVLTGPSGAGKTTVMNILGGMDRATGGEITVDDWDIISFHDKELREYRRSTVGYVLALDNLISTMTVKENVELAARLVSHPFDPDRALENVELEEKADSFPLQLTRAERVKAAVARAMVKHPAVLLLDEPLHGLGTEEIIDVLDIIYEICRETGKTVLLATQLEAAADMADRVVRLRNGHVEKRYYNRHRKEIEDISW